MDRMHPAKEGTWVQSLVREDSTCHRATKLRAPQLLKLTCPRARALQEEKPLQSEPRAPQLESSPCSLQQEKTPSQQQRPAQPKVKNKCFKEGYAHLNAAAAAAAKSPQSCLTLCDPIDGSPPGSSVHGIFQARVLEWVAIAFSGGG